MTVISRQFFALDQWVCGIVLAGIMMIAYEFYPTGSAVELEMPGDTRDRLTFEDLKNPTPGEIGLVHNGYFVAVGEQAAAHHELVGTLEVTGEGALTDRTGWPNFEATFFTHKGRLVPTERDIIHSDFGDWSVILSEGRVWSEPGDEGWSRASFPFVLTDHPWNVSHNGIATFLYNDTQVSRLRVQITQESNVSNHFDTWGVLALDYSPSQLPELAQLEADFELDLAGRIPVRPWSDYDFPAGSIPEAGFEGVAQNVTTSALLIDGTLYASPCRTRYGDYPYCAEMRHGIFSSSKTAVAALSLFWLAQEYGEDVYAAKIADYLDVTASHDGWDNVTFSHTLNMMTGVGGAAPERDYDEYVFEDDDRPSLYVPFSKAQGKDEKLNAVFGEANYDWGPGEVGRYNSRQTFVLSAAMDAFLKHQEGPDANIWDRVTESVLQPMGITVAPVQHTREADGSRGVPLAGWGYFPTLGEITKIAQLFRDNGVFQGRQLIDATYLHPNIIETDAPGYTMKWENAHGDYQYDMSFWYTPFVTKSGCRVMYAEMMGVGGNIISILPNGMIGVRMGDGEDFAEGTWDTDNMAIVANNLSPFCG